MIRKDAGPRQHLHNRKIIVAATPSARIHFPCERRAIHDRLSAPAQQDPRRIELPVHLGKSLSKCLGPARRQGSRQSLTGHRSRPFRHHQLQLASGYLPAP